MLPDIFLYAGYPQMAITNQDEITISQLPSRITDLLLRQLYISEICLFKEPAALSSSVADASASPPSSSAQSGPLHGASFWKHLIAGVISHIYDPDICHMTGGEVFMFTVPADAEECVIFAYGGMPGQTNGNHARFTGIRVSVLESS